MGKNATYYLGVDVGGTKIAAGLVAPEGQIAIKKQIWVKNQAGVQVSISIQTLILELIEAANQEGGTVTGVGVSIPGIYFAGSGKVWAPNIAGWDDFPLSKELQPVAATFNLPLAIDSDRAAYILGETWWGAARGCKDAIYLAIGTGIGAGILVDNRILRGSGDIAGAVGWFSLTDNYREEYARCGSFEYHASGEGLVRSARELYALLPDYRGILSSKAPDTWQTPDIFAAYEAGDELARQVMEQAIRLWGKAAANLISTFNPEVIVFGGGVFGPARRFLSAITEETRRWAQPISMQQVRLAVTELGPDAGLLGAAAIAMQKNNASV